MFNNVYFVGCKLKNILHCVGLVSNLTLNFNSLPYEFTGELSMLSHVNSSYMVL